MPTVYKDDVREMKGAVRGGLALVVHDPAELAGLQQLVQSTADLPGEPLDNLYRVIANAGSSLASWPGFTDSQRRYPPAAAATRTFEPVDNPSAALQAALGMAADAWLAQGPDIGELACAMLLPRPGRRLRFESKRPSLTLDYGSLRARALAAGAKLRQFGVTLFPVARSRRQVDLMELLRARATGLRLPRVETLTPADFTGKTGVVIFLHGLISTDVGTFDQFAASLQNEGRNQSLLLAAWPHDTLDPIDLNAEMLAEDIERSIGATSLPVAFVCHSRGGLVARRTAVELIDKNPLWRSRLRGCVTFGTPHHGAELAENGDELLGKMLFLKTTAQGAGFVPLLDALWAVKQFGKLPGVTDLRPRKNGGEFLKRLIKEEGAIAGAAGAMPMPVFAVGGNAPPAGATGWFTRHTFRGAPNDVVVALASTAPDHLKPQAETTCDHFGYFSRDETRKAHVSAAIAFLEGVLTQPRGAGASKGLDPLQAASHRTATRSMHKGDVASA